MSSIKGPNSSNEFSRILYDIDVVAIWKPDDEQLTDQETSYASGSGTDPSYSQFPRRVFKHVKYRLVRSLEGLVISTTVPPALLQTKPDFTSEWLMQLSPNGQYLAVLQEHKLEIRTSKSGFETNHAIFHSKREAFPKWRRIAWSLDSKILATSRSDGTIEIIDENGHLIYSISPSLNVNTETNKDLQNQPQSQQQASSSSSFFLEPVAFLAFVDPKRGSNKQFFNYEGYHYKHELLVITYDGILRSYLLNSPDDLMPSNSHHYVKKTNMTYSWEGSSDPGYFVFYHKYSFKKWLSTIVCGAVVTNNGLLLYLDRPYYRRLELEGTIDDSADDISNLSQGVIDTGLFSRIQSIFVTWGKRNKNFTDKIIHSMILSHDQQKLLTLDFSGCVKLWKVSHSKGVDLCHSWNQTELNYFARSREYKDLSYEQFIKKISDIECEGGNVSGISGLDNGKVFTIGWWTNEAIILGYQHGSLIIASLPDMYNILGDSPESFKSCLEIACQSGNRFLVIEHEFKTIRARVHGDNVISYSRAQEEGVPDEDEFDDSKSYLLQILRTITDSLHYITDTLLWHFESDSSTIRGKFITISKRTFRLNRISKILPQELLHRKINALEYDDALKIAETYNLDTDIIYQARWRDSDISENSIHDYLDKIHDWEWVLSTCINRIPKTPDMIRNLLKYGLDHTDILDEMFSIDSINKNSESKLELIKKNLREKPINLDSSMEEEIVSKIKFSDNHILICRYRFYFLKFLDRLHTYEDIVEEKKRLNIENGLMDALEENGNWVAFVDYYSKFAEDYASFREGDINIKAILFAQDEFFKGLHILFTRHGSEILPYRFNVLENIPETADPDDYESFLPSMVTIDNKEPIEKLWDEKPWREADWVENPIIKKKFFFEEQVEDDLGVALLKPIAYPAPSSIITQWYIDRAHKIDKISGQVDKALTFIHHGISKGVKGLETIEENLGMLSNLVYECYPELESIGNIMTLEEFEALSEYDIIQAFLKHTNELRIIDDVKKFVIPFLNLLPKRQARQKIHSIDGDDNNKHIVRFEKPIELLYDYILELSSTRLDLVQLIFEASMPVLDEDDRIIKSDIDLASVALSVIYGNPNVNQWEVMKNIHGYLPYFEYFEMDDCDSDCVDDIKNIKNFVPKELFTIFKKLDEKNLQLMINYLESHLNAAEIFSRYNNSVDMKWFLQSKDDYKMQKQLCVRLARKTGEIKVGNDTNNSDGDKWKLLLEEMIKLQGKGGVLEKISIEEIYKEFASGLLSSGRFRFAQEILLPSDKTPPLEADVAEKLVVDASREFFDNATTGNKNQGYMKMAYECLQILPKTKAISLEMEFIEATHILTENKVQHQAGIPLLPMQIRLSTNRLELISRLLSVNEKAYLEIETIMELASKLGYKNDKIAEVKVMAMIADSALRDVNFSVAYQMCIELIDIAKGIINKKYDNDNEVIRSVKDVSWRICYEVAKQDNFADLEKQMSLMGYALTMCPKEQIADILNLWRKIDSEYQNYKMEKIKLSEKYLTEKIKPAVVAAEAVESVLIAPLLQGDRIKNLVSGWFGS
ncbi:2974_t:CDS:2 [Entrophospora sp. SA101]|nr:2974_t:CDS:2 [Entrophospora sp. SA101]